MIICKEHVGRPLYVCLIVYMHACMNAYMHLCECMCLHVDTTMHMPRYCAPLLYSAPALTRHASAQLRSEEQFRHA